MNCRGGSRTAPCIMINRYTLLYYEDWDTADRPPLGWRKPFRSVGRCAPWTKSPNSCQGYKPESGKVGTNFTIRGRNEEKYRISRFCWY